MLQVVNKIILVRKFLIYLCYLTKITMCMCVCLAFSLFFIPNEYDLFFFFRFDLVSFFGFGFILSICSGYMLKHTQQKNDDNNSSNEHDIFCLFIHFINILVFRGLVKILRFDFFFSFFFNYLSRNYHVQIDTLSID